MKNAAAYISYNVTFANKNIPDRIKNYIQLKNVLITFFRHNKLKYNTNLINKKENFLIAKLIRSNKFKLFKLYYFIFTRIRHA